MRACASVSYHRVVVIIIGCCYYYFIPPRRARWRDNIIYYYKDRLYALFEIIPSRSPRQSFSKTHTPPPNRARYTVIIICIMCVCIGIYTLHISPARDRWDRGGWEGNGNRPKCFGFRIPRGSIFTRDGLKTFHGEPALSRHYISPRPLTFTYNNKHIYVIYNIDLQ